MSQSAPRTYGNWRQPTSPGLGRLGLAGTAVMFGGLLVIALVMYLSWMLAVGLAVVLGIGMVPMLVTDRHGRNGLQWMTARTAWSSGKSKGQHLYRSGPLGRIPVGTCRLPGLAAASTLHEAHDAYGRPFAILSVPATNHHTVVLTCSADGASLVDSDQIDTWVAYWGHWLSQLAHEPRLVAASVTVEAAPDTGERLRREVEGNIAGDAPELSKYVLREVVETYPVGSAQLATRVALTYSGAGVHAGGRKTAADMALELGTRVPGLANGLQMTGAGPARPMGAEELAEAVRVAYDPSVAGLIEQARATGGSQLTWNEAGPIASQESWDHYRHDGAFSITWSMSEAPRGEVYANVLTRLVAPHADITRKRITLLYRPHDAGTAARLVERDRKDALFRAQQGKMIQARDSAAVSAADQSAREEATGAGLVRFGMLVTATVSNYEDLEVANAAIDNLSATARLQLRRVYGSQASAFAAALPLGLVLPNHLKVPQQLREAM
ncbi:SCO6880 family protein [Streptodolium elevatio]|uniref:SCO6880 family protein n=1 Tax=Streptodolium elevatio TaxID=3157996 RepID=A0ABV3D896_9ACTN